MKLARSTYYYRSRRAAAREKALRDSIVALCEEFPRYGYRRVTHQLRAEGMSIRRNCLFQPRLRWTSAIRLTRSFLPTAVFPKAN